MRLRVALAVIVLLLLTASIQSLLLAQSSDKSRVPRSFRGTEGRGGFIGALDELRTCSRPAGNNSVTSASPVSAHNAVVSTLELTTSVNFGGLGHFAESLVLPRSIKDWY
jgi:hypothetical protein